MTTSAAVQRWREAELITWRQASEISRRLRGRDPKPDSFEDWVEEGLITPNQAAEIRGFEKASTVAAAVPEQTAEPVAQPPPPSIPVPPSMQLALPTSLPRPAGLTVRARPLGLLLAALALASLTLTVVALVTDLFIAPWRLAGPDLEDAVRLVAAVLGFMGGLRLYRGGRDGKPPVLASLLLNAAATVTFGLGRFFDALLLLQLAGWALLFYLTAISDVGGPQLPITPGAEPGSPVLPGQQIAESGDHRRSSRPPRVRSRQRVPSN